MTTTPSKSVWVNFGIDKEQAEKDAKSLSSALGHPVYLAEESGQFFCAPLSKLVGVKEEDLPKNKELINHKH
jgi:hypothetical protein